jgi:hypothetical protein
MQHEHFADGFRRRQPDQPLRRIDDAYRRDGFLLQQPECLIEAAAVAYGRDAAGHHVGNARDMPRADDLPSVVSDLVEIPAKTNPLGIKGIGEAGTIGPRRQW